MVFTPEQLQQKRTPHELKVFAESVRDSVRADSAEIQHGTLKKGLYKEFLDEILPLSYFAELEYPCTFSVEPRLGPQPFDAVVYNENGDIYEYVELTIPHDGAEAARDARRRVKQGGGLVHVGDPGDDIIRLTPVVLQTCRQKALKDYSETKLVVIVNVQPPFQHFEELYEAKLGELTKQVAEIRFNAKDVVLFFPPNRVERMPDTKNSAPK